MKEIVRSCIDCGLTNCEHLDKHFPNFCLTTALDEDEIEQVRKMYMTDTENDKVARASAEVEMENYCKMTRVEETMEFAKKMGYHKLGIATCVGLISESRMLAKILRANGFEVYGIACKVGAQKKESIGIKKECETIGINMCNPIMQAKLLNKEKTELNIVMGLCVGHDSLFYKYSEALTTTLVTKDRVLGHNAVAALHCANSYYQKLLISE